MNGVNQATISRIGIAKPAEKCALSQVSSPSIGPVREVTVYRNVFATRRLEFWVVPRVGGIGNSGKCDGWKELSVARVVLTREHVVMAGGLNRNLKSTICIVSEVTWHAVTEAL